MTLVETEEVATQPPLERLSRPDGFGPVRVQGKFFFVGEQKLFIKGVTYGPFPEGSHGAPFPEPGTVDLDFALMAEAGRANAELQSLEAKLLQIQAKLQDFLLLIPNPPHASVPLGQSPENNVEVRRHGWKRLRAPHRRTA